MATSIEEERERAIYPIVPEAVEHNSRIVSQLRSLTASLFGVAAGVLGLEAIAGFAFYLAGTAFVSQLVATQMAGGQPRRYFEDLRSGLWMADVVGATLSYVLTWTLFFGLVRS